jgi:hypothetical protein
VAVNAPMAASTRAVPGWNAARRMRATLLETSPALRAVNAMRARAPRAAMAVAARRLSAATNARSG